MTVDVYAWMKQTRFPNAWLIAAVIVCQQPHECMTCPLEKIWIPTSPLKEIKMNVKIHITSDDGPLHKKCLLTALKWICCNKFEFIYWSSIVTPWLMNGFHWMITDNPVLRWIIHTSVLPFFIPIVERLTRQYLQCSNIIIEDEWISE